jgi:hypothetical protein
LKVEGPPLPVDGELFCGTGCESAGEPLGCVVVGGKYVPGEGDVVDGT